MDKVTEPLPYEWYQLLCILECTQIMGKNDYPRLEREWDHILGQEWLEKTPESESQFKTECEGSVFCTVRPTSNDPNVTALDPEPMVYPPTTKSCL